MKCHRRCVFRLEAGHLQASGEDRILTLSVRSFYAAFWPGIERTLSGSLNRPGFIGE